jgi:hypothetical protein
LKKKHSKNVAAIPVENPADGGSYHLVPMPGSEINRLAKKITRISYLADGRGKTIFNQHGKPVPQFEKDDDALITEALRWCQRISNVGEESEDGSVRPWEDPQAQAAGFPPGTILDEALRREIFAEYMELELDVAEDDVPPGQVDSSPDVETKKPKKRKVGMLVAEWAINEASKLGQAKRQEEQKNS